MKKFYLCKLCVIVIAGTVGDVVLAQRCTGDMTVYQREKNYFEGKDDFLVCSEVKAFNRYAPNIDPEDDDCMYFAAAFNVAQGRGLSCVPSAKTHQQTITEKLSQPGKKLPNQYNMAESETKKESNPLGLSDEARFLIKAIGLGVANSLESRSGSRSSSSLSSPSSEESYHERSRRERNEEKLKRDYKRLCEQSGGRVSLATGTCKR